MKYRLGGAFLFLFANLTVSSTTNASVTIVGNRFIYNENTKTMDVLLKNNDNIPYVMQAWVDSGDENSKPEKLTATPFILLPPLFKIDPLTNRTIRLQIKSDQNLPRDRESLFWLNVMQIPPSNLTGTTKTNSILFLIRNRLKLFYRPKVLGKPDDTFAGVDASVIDGKRIKITNTRPWYLSLSNVSVFNARHSVECLPETVPPYSTMSLECRSSLNDVKYHGEISLSAFNDQGARTSATFATKK